MDTTIRTDGRERDQPYRSQDMFQGSAIPELIPKGPRRRMKRRRGPRKTSSSGKHVFREGAETRKVKLRWAQRRNWDFL